jgi:putative nucleotidyltransferase with HDIG domain
METPGNILKQLEKVRDLPTLPLILDRLNQAIRDPDSNVASVAAIIEDDPAMMARILKVVNSAFYGIAEPVASIHQAVTRMGFNAVGNIAMATSVLQTMQDTGNSGLDKEQFWRHCISTGIAATVIYDRTRTNLRRSYEPELLRLSGLLHDIGKVIFIRYFGEDFARALAVSREKQIPLQLAEQDVLQCDHAAAGAWLGLRWRLPAGLIEVIHRHHEPDSAPEEHRELVMLCHCANYICNHEHIGDSGDCVAPAFFYSVWKRLGLQVRDIAGVVDQVKEQSAKSAILLAMG